MSSRRTRTASRNLRGLSTTWNQDKTAQNAILQIILQEIIKEDLCASDYWSYKSEVIFIPVFLQQIDFRFFLKKLTKYVR